MVTWSLIHSNRIITVKIRIFCSVLGRLDWVKQEKISVDFSRLAEKQSHPHPFKNVHFLLVLKNQQELLMPANSHVPTFSSFLHFCSKYLLNQKLRYLFQILELVLAILMFPLVLKNLVFFYLIYNEISGKIIGGGGAKMRIRKEIGEMQMSIKTNIM